MGWGDAICGLAVEFLVSNNIGPTLRCLRCFHIQIGIGDEVIKQQDSESGWLDMATCTSDNEWRITFSLEEWRYAEERRDRRADFPIFRVPKTLLKENVEAYIPQMISLGPFHFLKSEELRAMETEKRETARHYIGKLPNDFLQPLELIGKGKASILQSDNFFSKVLSGGKNSYDGINLQTSDQEAAFACMMFRDALFVSVFLHEFHWSEIDGVWVLDESGKPVFIDIIKDFVKLENQVPFILVKALHEHINADLKISFDDFVLEKCRCLLPFVIDEEDAFLVNSKGVGKRNHLLECVRELLVGIKPQNNVVRVHRTSILKHCLGQFYSWMKMHMGVPHSTILEHCWGLLFSWMKKPHRFCFKRLAPRCRHHLLLSSAVQLKKAGIKFKPFSDGGGIRNIRFDNRTFTLHLPEIRVDILTETVMRNVIAFELYSSVCKEKVVTSYAHLMNDLIDTKEDVALLRKSGIIFHCLGSDGDVAKLWNTLSNSTSRPFVQHIFQATSDMKDVYKRMWWRILWSEFKEAYCWKPWIFVSAMAATFLLGMTVAQVVCLFDNCQ